MISKGFILVLLSTLLLIAITGTIYVRSHQSNALPTDLYKQFRCDRMTLEALSTDQYCNDYNLYKKDHTAGRI
ncbi:MAG: hypothetical protein JWL89_295 [Candidatus Saccharibacteria bacterium]|nr:hypothetical protein [Candidatus Saccharibacteria bacterium]